MSELDRAILSLLMQLHPEDSAKYSHALYQDCAMFTNDRLELIKNWLKDAQAPLKWNTERTLDDDLDELLLCRLCDDTIVEGYIHIEGGACPSVYGRGVGDYLGVAAGWITMPED